MKVTDFEYVKKFRFQAEDTDTNDVRARELDWLSRFIRDDGYNLEFGVFSGFTISCLATARPDLEFDGFDSFEGLPEDWDTGEKYVNKKAFSVPSIPEVPDNVRLHQGWFEETLPVWLEQNEPKNITYLHLDADLYSSTKTVLDSLNHMIVAGTIIRLDELCCWRTVFGEASPRSKANRALYGKWKEHEWKAMIEWMQTYDRKVVPVCRNWFQGGTVVVTQ